MSSTAASVKTASSSAKHTVLPLLAQTCLIKSFPENSLLRRYENSISNRLHIFGAIAQILIGLYARDPFIFYRILSFYNSLIWILSSNSRSEQVLFFVLYKVYPKIRTVVKSGVLCITNQDSLEKGRVIPTVSHDIFLAPFGNLLIFIIVDEECIFVTHLFCLVLFSSDGVNVGLC